MTQVTGDRSLQSRVLEDLSDARLYRRWLADLARPYLGDHPIEIGSGTGDYALEWCGDVTRFTVTEAEHDRLEALRERFADHARITVEHLHLTTDGGAHSGTQHTGRDSTVRATAHHSPERPDLTTYSAVIAVNVLEHIPDDAGALRAAARLVRPGGAVVLIVPAFPSAMSRFDRAIGHQRRYTRASLSVTLARADLGPEQLRYINPVGLLSWYVTVKALRMTPRNGPALRIYDRLIVPVARLADRLPMPFGQSVFAVARVPHRS